MPKDYTSSLKDIQSRLGKLGAVIKPHMAAYSELHKAAVADGALSPKVKELMALASSICMRCEGCILFHLNAAIKAGASKEEVAESIGVAVQMGGGPAVIYGSIAAEALEQML
ncbi:MAG: carboxymuconolactone decarboxylase family protein [Bdellovibrionales bacterium]|nr:carboxymuconolactone decarboxylase family protein [Bdellovibrionales bacterium]